MEVLNQNETDKGLERIDLVLQEMDEIKTLLAKLVLRDKKAQRRSTKLDLASTTEAERELRCHRTTLYNRIKDGTYRQGVEVFDHRRVGTKMPVWHFDLEKCKSRNSAKD